MTGAPAAAARVLDHVRLHLSYAMLGAGCLAWNLAALLLLPVVPAPRRSGLGRRAAMLGFRLYLGILQVIGAARFDLRAIDSLRGRGAMVIAPNHPGLLDALMVISRLPDLVCVQKASLQRSPLWGAGSRLAGYIRNDWFVGSVRMAVEELHTGHPLLLFPEGTRNAGAALGEFHGAVGYVAYRARVPIQTLIIEQDTRFLAKGWPLLRCPRQPMHFRVRLGRCFDPPRDPAAFVGELREYFLAELARPAP